MTPALLLECLLVQRGFQPPLQRRFQLLLVTYVYSVEEETFVAVPDLPADLPAQLCAAVQHLHYITSGLHSNSYTTYIVALVSYSHFLLLLQWSSRSHCPPMLLHL